jgi:hypothetical protein
MEIFEAQYPCPLQQVIDHAERFIALLSSTSAHGQALNAVGPAWLTGRIEELETMIGTFVADWRRGRLPEQAAVIAISSYLAAMHAGAERHLGIGPEAACCIPNVANKIPATPYAEDLGTADTLPGSPAALADLGEQEG